MFQFELRLTGSELSSELMQQHLGVSHNTL